MVLDILRRELQLIMRQSGVTSIQSIGAAYVSERH
jgi:isopentenyl diphosphate isomerase/L-lactate dehydrogenase-like FMN-dependent dehydrogenase